MKYLAVELVSGVLVFVGLNGLVAQAQTVEVTPFQLIFLAQDGYLEDQGIPKGNLLLDEVAANQITASDLVEAAIADQRLSSDTLSDEA